VAASIRPQDIADYGEGLSIGLGRHHPALVFIFICWHLGIVLTSRISCIAGHGVLMLTSNIPFFSQRHRALECQCYIVV
jgi:hypothetical protein